MSKYITEMSNILCNVLDRAARAQPAQFAGYWANIDFWFAEYEHLAQIAAGYDERYRAMEAAYEKHISEHGGPHNRDDCNQPYQTVGRSNDSVQREAVWAARESLDRLIERAHRVALIDFPECDRLIDRLKSVYSR